MSNSRDRSIRLPNGATVGLDLLATRTFLTLTAAQAASLGIEPSGRQDGPSSPRDPETTEWWGHVDIRTDHAAHRTRILGLLIDYEDMCSGRLGTIKITKLASTWNGARRLLTNFPTERVTVQGESRSRNQLDAPGQGHRDRELVMGQPGGCSTQKDGTIRFCVNHRRLNAKTKRNSDPIPGMAECIDSLGDGTVFSTLGCNSGYWQFVVQEPGRGKTTFTSYLGLFRIIGVSFRLKKASATFQNAVDITLSRMK